MAKRKTPLKFVMPFEPMTIEHLGLRLYSTLPPVITELVSNAYDANAPRVDVSIPTGRITASSEVIVRDYGHGMDADALRKEYLPIGRNRRDKKGKYSKGNKRLVTGRKGLGKLSAFGIATELEVAAYQKGRAICLRLNYEDMLSWAKSHAIEQPYEATVVERRTGSTTKRQGVEVTLRKFHRTKAISPEVVRRGLARRLNMIGGGFQVLVNGIPIGPGDRVKKRDCADGFSWDLADTPTRGKIGEGLTVDGWIGFLSESSQANRGVDIFANRKAVELASYFNSATTHVQFARAHLVGEVHADFLDADDDLIATARNSVMWESQVGVAFQGWGQDLLKWAFREWLELRRKDKETKVVTAAGFDKWMQTRQPTEQRVAKRMLRLLTSDPNIEPESAKPLLEIVKSSVETVAFHELVETIENEGVTPAALLRLFDEWRVIEARAHLKLADGRMEAMTKLKRFMDAGALEVKQMQPLLQEHLWLVDPAWTEADGQTTYTTWLRKHCKEPKDYEDVDRRLDIVGVRTGGEVCVLELKRPDKSLSRRDLEQIVRYVDWARAQFVGSGRRMYLRGLLVVGKLTSFADVQSMQRRLSGDGIEVETYEDLYQRAKTYCGRVDGRLKHIAPEYARSKRRAAATAERKAAGKAKRKAAAKAK